LSGRGGKGLTEEKKWERKVSKRGGVSKWGNLGRGGVTGTAFLGNGIQGGPPTFRLLRIGNLRNHIALGNKELKKGGRPVQKGGRTGGPGKNAGKGGAT